MQYFTYDPDLPTASTARLFSSKATIGDGAISRRRRQRDARRGGPASRESTERSARLRAQRQGCATTGDGGDEGETRDQEEGGERTEGEDRGRILAAASVAAGCERIIVPMNGTEPQPLK